MSFTLSPQETCSSLSVNPKQGLNSKQVATLLELHGRNGNLFNYIKLSF